MYGIIFLLVVGLMCYGIYLFCKAGVQTGKGVRNVIEKNADEYDERHKKKEVKEEKKDYDIEDENVKKVFKELKKSDNIDDVVKKLKMKKGEVYEIKLFLEDEGLL